MPSTSTSGYMKIRWYQQSSHGGKSSIAEKYRLPAVAVTATTHASASSRPARASRIASSERSADGETRARAQSTTSSASAAWPTSASSDRKTATSTHRQR
jgi:hypothetical protein